MAANSRLRTRSAPLKVEITRAAARLRERRRRVDLSAAALRHNLGRHLTSPMMLLLAGGVGFVAGDLANRDSGSERTGDSQSLVKNLFASATSLVALIRSVLAMSQMAEMTASERDDKPDPQER
jgi:opacity protein-like surface antigen